MEELKASIRKLEGEVREIDIKLAVLGSTFTMLHTSVVELTETVKLLVGQMHQRRGAVAFLGNVMMIVGAFSAAAGAMFAWLKFTAK